MEELETQSEGVGPEQELEAPAVGVAEQPLDAGEPSDAGQPSESGEAAQPEAALFMEDLLPPAEEPVPPAPVEDAQLKAVLEAIVYVTEDPLTLIQIAAALHEPVERVRLLLDQLVAEFEQPGHGLTVKEVAGGFKMSTKAEHHDAVRNFVKSLKPPLKLSLPALETLAVIAYKQPVTAPEIMEIRGVQGAGVLKTLIDRKLITPAGRKNVVGKPILYKTTREFLIQFGLKDVTELPSLKEFEELRRLAFSDTEPAPESASASAAEGSGAETPAGTAETTETSEAVAPAEAAPDTDEPRESADMSSADGEN